jgi:hypothetical protein
MISKFKEIVPGKLYRGSAPSPKDVEILKNKYGINKIVSLDQKTGDAIDRACSLLNIKQIKSYINFDKQSLIDLFSNNLKKLLLSDGPTYFHCHHGKDRTGLLAAIFKCKYMGMDPEDAIQEAKSLGFGIGVNPKVVKLYEKLIRSCKSSDINNSIVSNEREYLSDNRDSFLNPSDPKSFAPFTAIPYNSTNDQYPTRDNYDLDEPIKGYKSDNSIPQVGVYNNQAGINGAGPSENLGGFIND